MTYHSVRWFQIVSILFILVSWRLIKDSGIDLKDVAATSETILGLDVSSEQKCRSKEPIVQVEDLDVGTLKSILISNLMACLVTLILLVFDGFSCGPFITQQMKQPVLCTLQWMVSTLTFLSVNKYCMNLAHYDANLSYVVRVHDNGCIGSDDDLAKFRPQIPKWNQRIESALECTQQIRVPRILHVSMVTLGAGLVGLTWYNFFRDLKISY